MTLIFVPRISKSGLLPKRAGHDNEERERGDQFDDLIPENGDRLDELRLLAARRVSHKKNLCGILDDENEKTYVAKIIS